MAILEKKIKGKSYFYEVKSYREDGKIKQKILRYFGREDPRKNPDAKPVVKQQVIGTYKFGEVALLWHCAKQIKFVETIDKYMPKRQGLSHGLLLFLLASHRIFGDKPSAENLQDWVKRTFLPLFLDFTSKKINKNSISYTMDSVIDEERKIDQTFHIARDLYDIAKGKLGKDEDIYFYDITSTYFEGRSCPLAFLGYSRDGLSDKLQINIGLIVDKTHGLPLMTKVFEGNINDTKTVYEVVYYTKFILKKEKYFIIMDRGMDSKDNIMIVDTTGNDYIIGISNKHGFVKNLKRKTKPTDPHWQKHVIKDKKILLKKITKNIFGKRRFIVMYYNQEMAATQQEIRERKISFAEQQLKKEMELTLPKAKKIIKGVSKYLKIKKTNKKISWSRNQVAINQKETLDGKFCMITNKDMNAREIYDLYFSKDKVEKAFRHMKQDLNLHPTRRRIPNRVRTDIFVCHLAYLLLKFAENLLKMQKIEISWDNISTETKEIRLLHYKKRSGNSHYDYITNNQIQKNIVDKLYLNKYLPVTTTKPKTSSET